MMQSNDRQPRIKSETMIFLITLGTVGIALIGIGALARLTPLPDLFDVFAAIGGAVFGAAISLLLARYFEPSEIGRLSHLIALSHECSLTRNDEVIDPFRRKFYGYLRSHTTAGEPVWRYRIFDFSQAHTPGHLHATIDVILPEGGSKKFVYDGFVCGQHLLLVGHPVQGAESHVIHVFPNGCLIDSNQIGGLSFVRSFSGQQLVTPTLLSSVPLAGLLQPGEVTGPDANVLMKKWREAFHGNTFNIDTLAPTPPADATTSSNQTT